MVNSRKLDEWNKLLQLADQMKKNCEISAWDDVLNVYHLIQVKCSLVVAYKVLLNLGIAESDEIIPISKLDKNEVESEMVDDSFYYLMDDLLNLFSYAMKKTGWEIYSIDYEEEIRLYFQERGLWDDYEESPKVEAKEIKTVYRDFISTISSPEGSIKKILSHYDDDFFFYFENRIQDNIVVTEFNFFENKEIGIVLKNLERHEELRSHPLIGLFEMLVSRIKELSYVNFPQYSLDGHFLDTYCISFVNGYVPDTGEEVNHLSWKISWVVEIAVMSRLLDCMKKELPVLFLKGGNYEKAV